MNDVQPENKRNVQARFFDSNVLVSVCLLCSGDVEQRTDLSLCDHVFVVGASGAGTSLLARRVLHQLSDPFFEGHLAEKGLHSGIQAGISYAAGLHLRCWSLRIEAKPKKQQY